MTVFLLASICLFAFIVAGRPVPSGSDIRKFASTSSTLLNTAQAGFQIHAGVHSEDVQKLDAARFPPQSLEREIKYIYISKPEAENIVASFETSHKYDVLLDARLDALDINKVTDPWADNYIDDPVFSGLVAEQGKALTDPLYPTATLAMLAFSSGAAFLALACIALAIYVIRVLRSQILASKRAWDLLPRFRMLSRSAVPQENTLDKRHLPLEGSLLFLTEVEQQIFPDVEQGSTEKQDLHLKDKVYAVSDMALEPDDLDGIYQDALDRTPLPSTSDLPLVEHHSCIDDPPLPPLDPLNVPTNDHSTPLTRELYSSPISRPAWSVRAMDSPAFGLTSREVAGVDFTPLPLIHPPRRAYRSAVPEFDIALAMQLRPGLGIGADSAWMVRFLMAIFGWFTVALTGSTR